MFNKEIVEYSANVNIDIGRRIQERRIKCGLSGATLGAYLGISANQVSRIETGKARCSIEHFFVIAQILNCSTDYLLFGTIQSHVMSQKQANLIKQLYQSISNYSFED